MIAESTEARAETIAVVVGARRTGRRWTGKCPAHRDQHPSLVITPGERGVLLKCWSAGCSAESIMAALKLPMSALFNDAPTTPAERAKATKAKATRDTGVLHRGAIDREKRDRVYRLEKLKDALGARLTSRSNDDKLADLFHLVCDRWHEAEAAAYADPQDGAARLPQPATVPGWICEELVNLAQSFCRKETGR